MQDTAQQLRGNIVETVIETGYEQMRDGFLPDLEQDRNEKSSFINRRMNVTEHLIGEAPDKEVLGRAGLRARSARPPDSGRRPHPALGADPHEDLYIV